MEDGCAKDSCSSKHGSWNGSPSAEMAGLRPLFPGNWMDGATGCRAHNILFFMRQTERICLPTTCKKSGVLQPIICIHLRAPSKPGWPVFSALPGKQLLRFSQAGQKKRPRKNMRWGRSQRRTGPRVNKHSRLEQLLDVIGCDTGVTSFM